MNFLFNSRITKMTIPYKVKQLDNENSICLEAKGIINDELFYFHVILYCFDKDNTRKVYLLLNENILKEIIVSFDRFYIERFSFDFKDILGKDYKNVIKVKDKKLLKEGTI